MCCPSLTRASLIAQVNLAAESRTDAVFLSYQNRSGDAWASDTLQSTQMLEVEAPVASFPLDETLE
jgi:hypothetical protein